jgi:hypothetical protein
MSWKDRIGRSLFVAAAVGLAWGIRGDFGHVIGAMYPGAILGLAWIFVCGSPALVSRMPTIAGLTAATIGAGGTMSYGILHGYAQADTLVNYTYGFFTLFCQGGCWGTFGCALAGLLAERKPMRTGDWLGLIGSVFLGGWLASVIVVEGIGFHVNPPRNDISVAFLGAAIGQFLWLATHDRPVGLRGATYGFIGFGLGMAFGRLMANAFRHLETVGWSINHWNVMEVTCGFVGGGVFTWGMLGLGRFEPDEQTDDDNSFRTPNAIGAYYVLVIIPLWHIAARTFEKYPKWAGQLKGNGFPNSDGLAVAIFFSIVVLGSIAAIVGAAWAIACLRGRRWPMWFPVVFLSFTMLLYQNFMAHTFWTPLRLKYVDMHFVLMILFASLCIYAAVVKPTPIANSAKPMPLRWIVVGTGISFALIIALASRTNGDLTMKSANTRWPQWTWSSGPFPGRVTP